MAKAAEMMASLKDPEVMAKAAEMMKDPTYMAAAKAKVQELQAKATQNGMLDADGNPVQNNMAKMMAGLAGQQAAAGGASDARERELENIARHKSGELNDAELGMANMQKAMQDPSLLASIREMMKDPNTMAEVQKMMADPAFKAQAQQVAENMKSGGMDFSKMAEMMGGMGGGG